MLWNTDEAGNQLETDVEIYLDGIKRTFKPGEKIEILPGNSISLTPHIAHIFGPKPGTGELVAGEVSKVNDDNTDNYFMEMVGRFPPSRRTNLPTVFCATNTLRPKDGIRYQGESAGFRPLSCRKGRPPQTLARTNNVWARRLRGVPGGGAPRAVQRRRSRRRR